LLDILLSRTHAPQPGQIFPSSRFMAGMTQQLLIWEEKEKTNASLPFPISFKNGLFEMV
jgi:hypothetical protein